MSTRNLDPELAPILDAIEAGGMFDDGMSYAQMRERFELTAPLMWDASALPVDRVEDRVVAGPGGALPVRIYTPTTTPHPLPVLVYFHGGGFTIGSIETADPMCRYLARAARCIVVNVGFRLAPEDPFPAPVDDCWAALRWCAANASTFGGDPARVAVGGDASGGTYAAVCALRSKDEGGPQLRLQLLLSPCTEFAEKYPSRIEFADDRLIPGEMVDALMDAYAPAGVDRTDWRLSPIRHRDPSGVAPAYILASEYDFLRDEERAFSERLAASGVPVDFVCWDGTVHNFFSMYDHLDVARRAMADAAGALQRAFEQVSEG